MPKSCVLYLRGGAHASNEDELELELADGQTDLYRVPSVSIEDYTIDKIFGKKLLMFLPYYIMRYERFFDEIARDDENTKRLVAEYSSILAQLEDATRTDQEGTFRDMVRLMRRVLEYQLRKENHLQERMDEIMGGKVLDLPSDQLREERRKGIEQGIEAMIEICMEVGIRQEDAAAKLKSKFSLPEALIEEYMEKYWK